jgi:hypothetical protein
MSCRWETWRPSKTRWCARWCGSNNCNLQLLAYDTTNFYTRQLVADLHLARGSEGPVDAPGDIQLQSQTVEGGHRAGRDRRDLYRPGLLFLLALQDIFDAAETLDQECPTAKDRLG